MAEIIAFPTKSVRIWADIERALRDMLATSGVSDATRERVTGRMMEFFELINIDMDLFLEKSVFEAIPAEQTSAILFHIGEEFSMQTGKQLKGFADKLIRDRIYCEIELCIALGLS